MIFYKISGYISGADCVAKKEYSLEKNNFRFIFILLSVLSARKSKVKHLKNDEKLL